MQHCVYKRREEKQHKIRREVPIFRREHREKSRYDIFDPNCSGNGKIPHNSRYHGIKRDLKPERYYAAGSECAFGHEEGRCQSKAVNAAVSRGHHAVGQPPLCRAGSAAVECCAERVDMQNDDEEQCAKQMFLLTTKPVLYVCNVDDVSAASGNQYVEQVREAIKGEDAELIIISAQTEADIAELETYEEKQMFLEDLGLKESGCNRLIKTIYSLLNLETFITAGEMEVKAWTYRKGWKAPQCAGVIHTDFEKGFIRAEVIKYEDYIKYGSEAAVREAGKLGVEGKEYVVQDGDIMHFRFNV